MDGETLLSETAPLVPKDGDEGKIDTGEDQEQASIVKSKIMPHTFFEGYGSIIEIFAENDTANVQTWSRLVVEKYLSKVSSC